MLVGSVWEHSAAHFPRGPRRVRPSFYHFHNDYNVSPTSMDARSRYQETGRCRECPECPERRRRGWRSRMSRTSRFYYLLRSFLSLAGSCRHQASRTSAVMVAGRWSLRPGVYHTNFTCQSNWTNRNVRL